MNPIISEITAQALGALFPDQNLGDVAERADAIARKGEEQQSFTLSLDDFREQFIKPAMAEMYDKIMDRRRFSLLKNKIQKIRLMNRGR